MTLIVIKLLVDGVMVLLLGATIFYCYVVNRRIRVLQDSREDFAQLIHQFDEATKKAQESVEELQTMSARVTDSLNERLDKANFLADDLAFMIEKGNKVADKVDKTLAKEDRQPKDSVLPPKREPMIGRNRKKEPSASDTLLKAGAKELSPADAKKERVESMLERLGDKKAGSASSRRKKRTSARLRSKAEQDLQNALKSGNES